MLSTGVRRSSPGMTVGVAPNDVGHPRLGIIVTRQIRGSVRRNRVKRVLREGFRTTPEVFSGGRDFVLIARGELLEMPTREIWEQMARLARSAEKKLQSAAQAEARRGETAQSTKPEGSQ